MRISRTPALVALLLLSAASVFLAVGQSPSQAEESHARAVRMNNLGVAYMNQQRFQDALDRFREAQRLEPSLTAPRLNQAIALLNLQQSIEAEQLLRELTRTQPEYARAWYNLGLLYKNQGAAASALEAFKHASQLAPTDADARYFLGWAQSQLEDYDAAIASLEQALGLNRFHVSAEFALARAYQRSGKTAEAREHLARYQELIQQKLGAPISLAYGDQGMLSLAENIAPPSAAAPAAIALHFADATKDVGLQAVELASASSGQEDMAAYLAGGACLFDYDSDGRPDLFLPSRTAAQPQLFHNTASGFQPDSDSGLSTPGALGCAVGDYDNDGHPDVAVSFLGKIALFRNLGDGSFQDVTKASGIGEGCACLDVAMGLTFLDYDHDGDLDLYVPVSPDVRLRQGAADASALREGHAMNVLWRNNGNGTFTDITEQAGLFADDSTVAAVATDFNNDRAIDLLLTGWQPLPQVFLNPREGKFSAPAIWRGSDFPSTLGAAVFDFDKDGWMDVAFTHDGAPGISLWRNREGKSVEQVALPDLGWQRGWGIAAVDYDNDGLLDLAALGEDADGTGQVRLLRNLGDGHFQEVSSDVGLTSFKLTRPRALIAADYDLDGDSDLLLTQNGSHVLLLRNDGGNQNHSFRIALQGLNDNKSAIGTKVEVYAGDLWQKFEVQGASGYLGQSSLPILAGLRQAQQADVVRMLWPTGVVQDEIEIASGQTHSIMEIDRRGSSCPIVFAWDGRRFTFISDAIGPGIFGHWVAPGERNLPDPDEYVKISGDQLRARDGRLELRLLEPMEELVYLDQVRLLAVDHPADVAIHPNERFSAIAPPPEFRVIASRDARPPAAALDDQGRDVLPLLLHADHRYVEGFSRAAFKGFAPTHWLELDLGRSYSSGPLRLLLTGFTDYFTATSVYAAHQAGVVPIVPYVEALTPGGWVRVVDDMGFPAGLRRTMVADLSNRLPVGTRRIRIVTNLLIYWDQVLIDRTAGVPFRVSQAGLLSAELRAHGYPRVIEGHPASDLTYVYEEVSETGPYARHAGFYTRFGDVRSLVSEADDRFAVFGSAEEVGIAFDAASLPPLPAGWTRDYLLYLRGYDKDMDFYALNPFSVEPLPYAAMDRFPRPGDPKRPVTQLQYQLEYNTRPLSGREPAAYRFDYGKNE